MCSIHSGISRRFSNLSATLPLNPRTSFEDLDLSSPTGVEILLLWLIEPCMATLVAESWWRRFKYAGVPARPFHTIPEPLSQHTDHEASAWWRHSRTRLKWSALLEKPAS